MSAIFQSFLGGLPLRLGSDTRQISAENPTGAKGGGCRWDPDPKDPNLPFSNHALDLGKGWKVRPFIPLPARHTAILADIEGPGCINHLFLTSDIVEYRSLVLRMFWDDEASPSVETPMGDLFAMGHDRSPHNVYSLPVTVAPQRGCNSYWQMPFRRRARITVENDGPEDARVLAYRVLYTLGAIPEGAGYFHAQWRRSMTRREVPEHTIVDGIRGAGCYVGTYLAWTALSSGWWGEGEVKFYIDGDVEYPTMADNGTEDYFGGAWCFRGDDNLEKPFNSAFLGLPLAAVNDQRGPRRYSLYRWHILDSVGFARDLRVSVQALGWWPTTGPNRRFEPLTDDIASVAYWYQTEPHSPFPALPPISGRWSR